MYNGKIKIVKGRQDFLNLWLMSPATSVVGQRMGWIVQAEQFLFYPLLPHRLKCPHVLNNDISSLGAELFIFLILLS